MAHSQSADVIIAGLGAMGSATAYHLARQAKKVVGFDRYRPPHPYGSSHGETRIIREAYFEDPRYVPLVQHAYKLWNQLAAEASRPLLNLTGGLMIGPPNGVLISGARLSAQTHRLPFESLSAAELHQRFPALRPSPGMVAIWEPRAGILSPEVCVQTHLDLASRHGATLHFDEPVLRWQPDGSGLRIHTTRRTLTAQHLILTAGSWISSLLPHYHIPFTLERIPVFWFQPRHPSAFHPAHCPIHLWEYAPQQFFYGFPDLGHGVKIAFHHGQPILSADDCLREVSPHEITEIQQLIRPFLPELDGPFLRGAVCIYTNTPNRHFYLNHHPDHPQVLIASPCSGHGFKFSGVIGEILSDLVHQRTPPFDLSLFTHSP